MSFGMKQGQHFDHRIKIPKSVSTVGSRVRLECKREREVRVLVGEPYFHILVMLYFFYSIKDLYIDPLLQND